MADQTTISKPFPALEAGAGKAIDMASTIAGQPLTTGQMGLPQQAGVDAFTQQAQDLAASQLGLGSFTRDQTTGAVTGIGTGTGVAGYAPYLTGAGSQVGAAQLTGTGAGTGVGSLSTYMSPYQSAIKSAGLQQFDDQRLRDQQQLQADALKAGAFGGGRHGLTESDFLQQSLIDRTALASKYDADAFADARAARTDDREALMDLAKQTQLMGMSDIAQLGSLGQAGQLYGQAGLDTSALATQKQYQEPKDRVSWYANLLSGLGGGMGAASGYMSGPMVQQPTPGMSAVQSGLGGLSTLKYLKDIWNA